MSRPGQVGSLGRPWVTLDKPRPPRVDDHYRYWIDPPPELSERCLYWVKQLNRGWLPNRAIRGEGYDSSSQWYGVYIWEYQNVIGPMVSKAVFDTPNAQP